MERGRGEAEAAAAVIDAFIFIFKYLLTLDGLDIETNANLRFTDLMHLRLTLFVY